MPNYSDLYSLPSVSALSLPHYNSGSLSYLNYSKPISRYPGVYKPHLSTISEINSSYRRLNTPKLTYPGDISSRHIKPIKVINTADIDVSVNKYKKYEKKAQRLKSAESKTLNPEQQQQQLELKESTPKPAIRRDRATVRMRTVHTDTVKQEIGALKTWRDNFEPSELVSEVKTRKKTKGEILKEKFLIRSRSKENIPTLIEDNKKNTIKKTSSFRDICTAITSESISDDLNPGQPAEVQRRQSKHLSSENLLKEIRRVSVEFSPEDFSLLNTILSNPEEEEEDDESEISNESFSSVDLVNLSDNNNNKSESSPNDLSLINPNLSSSEKIVMETSDEPSKSVNLGDIRNKSKITNLKDQVEKAENIIAIQEKSKLEDTSETPSLKSVLKSSNEPSTSISLLNLGENSEKAEFITKKNQVKKTENNIAIQEKNMLEDTTEKTNLKRTKAEEVVLKSSDEPIRSVNLLNLDDNNDKTEYTKKQVEKTKNNITIKEINKLEDTTGQSSLKHTKVPKIKPDTSVSKAQVTKKNDTSLLASSTNNAIKKTNKVINENDQIVRKLGDEITKVIDLKPEVDELNIGNQNPMKQPIAHNTNVVSEKRKLKINVDQDKIQDNVPAVTCSKTDIANVEIQEIKYKTKPIITSSVEDIEIPKKSLVAVVDNVEVEKKPAKVEKKLKFNVTVKVDECNKKVRKKENLSRASIKEGKLIHPVTKKCVQNVLMKKLNTKQQCKKIKELKPIKVKTKTDNNHNENIQNSSGFSSVPEDSVIEQTIIEKIQSNILNTIENKANLTTSTVTSDDNSSTINESNNEISQSNKTAAAEPSDAENTKISTKLMSKRSLLNKPVVEDPDLLVFVPPPEAEPQPEPEEKKDVFVPLQSNRLTQWMHPWAKPEQFDECPVEIFARPKIIRGRHYPRPRKRNGATQIPANSEDNESNASDSDDSSTEDTSASLRSNDSGFGSTVPEKINPLQEETVTEKCETSDSQPDIFVPPNDGKIIPPATTLPRFKKYCVEDFDFLKVIGKGSFGKVLLSKLKETDYYYAVKCLKKDVIIEDDDVECTLIERKVLALGTKHPFLCHLLCTLQTESHLFFVMEYLNGGDLMFHITTRGSFPEEEARFYSAEVISGLQFLHSKGIIYRDLKLDNVLLDFDGHARLADFGMCQLQIFLDRMAESFCGTPDYMAPEIIKGQHYNQAVDWWSFGVLVYELFLGQSPFSGCDEDELFWSICNEKPVFPKHLSTYAVDLLTLLMEKDQSKRLGTRFSPHGPIRDHNFYRNLDWRALEARQIEPPFKPNVCHPLDTQYFDINFTKETVKLSPTELEKLENIDQSQFQGFSYTNPNATDK